MPTMNPDLGEGDDGQHAEDGEHGGEQDPGGGDHTAGGGKGPEHPRRGLFRTPPSRDAVCYAALALAGTLSCAAAGILGRPLDLLFLLIGPAPVRRQRRRWPALARAAAATLVTRARRPRPGQQRGDHHPPGRGDRRRRRRPTFASRACVRPRRCGLERRHRAGRPTPQSGTRAGAVRVGTFGTALAVDLGGAAAPPPGSAHRARSPEHRAGAAAGRRRTTRRHRRQRPDRPRPVRRRRPPRVRDGRSSQRRPACRPPTTRPGRRGPGLPGRCRQRDPDRPPADGRSATRRRSRIQAVVLAYETGQTRIGSTSGPSSRPPLAQPRADAQDPGVPQPQSPVALPDQLLDAFDGRVELWRLVGSVRAPTLPG